MSCCAAKAFGLGCLCSEIHAPEPTQALEQDLIALPEPEPELPPEPVTVETVETRYAHAGRRRRRITEDLFRCQAVDILKGKHVACGALLWQGDSVMLRDHLMDHLRDEEVSDLSDSEILKWYTQAARIAQEGIPDNDDE